MNMTDNKNQEDRNIVVNATDMTPAPDLMGLLPPTPERIFNKEILSNRIEELEKEYQTNIQQLSRTLKTDPESIIKKIMDLESLEDRTKKAIDDSLQIYSQCISEVITPLQRLIQIMKNIEKRLDKVEKEIAIRGIYSDE